MKPMLHKRSGRDSSFTVSGLCVRISRLLQLNHDNQESFEKTSCSVILYLIFWLTHGDRAASDAMSYDTASFHTQQVSPAASPASAHQTASQPQPASAVRPAELGKGPPSGPARQSQRRLPAPPSPAER